MLRIRLSSLSTKMLGNLSEEALSLSERNEWIVSF
jgi:hypothetical protein